jgi:hypothetical protein
MLYTADTLALKHILATGAVYQKSEAVRSNLGEIVGEGEQGRLVMFSLADLTCVAGLLFVEGAKHKHQV